MRLAGYEAKQVDAVLLHQANTFMVKTLGKKMGFTDEQTPSDIFADYGNQSSASIPATLVQALGGRLEAETLKLVGCGFGVGLSWGAFAVEIGPITVCPIQSFPR
jgi:3-oxoacyl-[acyl-carrier-protein] synthase-3